MKKPDNITKNDWNLLIKKYKNMDKVITKVDEGYPVQYLIGHVNFYGYQIFINNHVLIPRFETEYLVEKTINYINRLNLIESSVLELGTGSGCISVVLKKELPNLQITAVDVCNKALKIAKSNARYQKIKIDFIKKDMFKIKLINKYDIIISNPPYICEGELIDEKTKYEPELSIFTDKEGLKFYKRIFQIAQDNLNPKHLICLEINENQGNNIKKLAKQYFPNDKIIIEKDLANKIRYAFILSE